MPSFGGEVKPSVPCRRFAACKISLHLPWKLHAVGKIGSAISRPCFFPSLIEVAVRGAPLEMKGETKSGAQRARSYGLGGSGLQGPGSAPYSMLYSQSCVFSLNYPLPSSRNSIHKNFGRENYSVTWRGGGEWKGPEPIDLNYFSQTFFRINTPTFSTLVILHAYPPMKIEQCSETSAYKIQTPGNYPKVNTQHSDHGESLKSIKTVISTSRHILKFSG
jgi:hypothetical protein